MPLNFNKYSRCNNGRNKITNCDCSVSIVKSNNSKQITIAFYGNVLNRIVGKCEYIVFTTNDDNSRIYFTSANRYVGLKITQDSETRREIRRVMPVKESALWESWKGYYYIRYDKNEGYYYIEASEKIKED